MSKNDIYVEMAHHPQVVLDALEKVEAAMNSARVRQQVVRGLAVGLIIVGILGFILPILGVFDLTPLVCFLDFGFVFVGGALLTAHRPPHLQSRFDAARQILHTLRDDTGRKGHVVGWLDLGGPRQEEKAVRKARSLHGKPKVYYRDPWFKVKFNLVDGNLLRLTLEDKVKTKAGSMVRHQTQFSAKLVVNPELYRLGEVVTSKAQHHYTAGLGKHSGIGASFEDGALVLKVAGPAKDFSARRVLEKLKAMYDQLEPIQPTSVAGVEALGPEA